jgi:hypothetical protein
MAETRNSVEEGTVSLVTALFSHSVAAQLYMERLTLDAIAELIAKKYVEEHFAEIVSRLQQSAIVNLALARAGAGISQYLQPSPVNGQRGGSDPR